MQLTPYQPNADAPWDLSRVVHLHRRAGFGASWEVLQRDLADGPESSVRRLLGARLDDEADFASLSESIGSAAVASGDPSRLQAWWLLRMLKSSDPLGERLALMWHNHFAVSNLKVDDLGLMKEYLHQIDNHSRGSFGEILGAVVRSPAMLLWLDADANRQGRPNENLARELMELFTLGIGNYSEEDVKQAARALTGWSIRNRKFAFRHNRHDAGTKEILAGTGPLNGDQLLDLLCEQPATARRIAWRLCQTFLGEGVATDQVLSAVADRLQESSLDVKATVGALLRSQTFFSDANIRSHVAGPAEFIVGTLRSLDLTSPPPRTLNLAGWCERMGQNLFYPPNVGGWNEGRSWLSTRTVITRQNFAHATASGALWTTPPSALSQASVLCGRGCQILLGEKSNPKNKASNTVQALLSDPRCYLN